MKKMLSTLLVLTIVLTMVVPIYVSAATTITQSYTDDFSELTVTYNYAEDGTTKTGVESVTGLQNGFTMTVNEGNTLASDAKHPFAVSNNTERGKYLSFRPASGNKVFLNFPAAISSGSFTLSFKGHGGLNGTGDNRFAALVNVNGETVTDLIPVINGKKVSSTYTNAVGIGTTALTNDSAWHTYTYTVDMDNNTYTVTADGTTINSTITGTIPEGYSANALYFWDSDATNANWGLDDISLTINSVNYDVTFNDENGDLIETKQVSNGKVNPPQIVAPVGKTLVWVDGSGNAFTDWDSISSDMTLTARYDLIVEDFSTAEIIYNYAEDGTTKTGVESVTGLQNGFTMTVNEGNTLASDTKIPFAVSNNTERGKYLSFRPASGNKVFLNFPAAISSGSFTLSFKSHGGLNGPGDNRFAALVNVNGETVTDLIPVISGKKVSSTYTNAVGIGTTALTNDSGWHTYTYTVDMDNNTYTVTADGTTITPTITGTIPEGYSANALYFWDSDATNANWGLDDISLDWTKSIKVTFMCADGETVYRTENVSNGSVVAPTYETVKNEKFIGWMDENGNIVSDFINITSDMTVTAKVLSTNITESTDWENAEITLESDETITIASSNLLKNATIDATLGMVKIGTTTVKGIVRFNADGEIEPKVGDSLTFESAVSNDNTRHIGFIGTTAFNEVTDTKTLALTGGGKTFTAEFPTTGMIGNVMYQTAIKSVPSDISADVFVITFE